MNTVIVYDTDKDEIIEMIANVNSVGIHNDFTAVSYYNEDGEYDVKIVNHDKNIYITSI